MPKVLGLVNLHNTPELGALTENRTFASLSFLGRYSFIDIPLSNFANSNINQTAILIRDHIRSIIRHMDNSQAYTNNTKFGYDFLLYNEKYANNPFYNTDINNIIANEWLFKEHDYKYVILAPSHILYKLDFSKVLEQHQKLNSSITVVYTPIKDGKTSFIGGDIFDIDKFGLLKGISKNNGVENEVNASLETYVINMDKLVDIIEFAQETSAFFTIRDVIKYVCSTLRIDTYKYEGRVRRLRSIEDYLNVQLDFLKIKGNSYETNSWPIYTKTHDTPPARYLKNSAVTNSFVCNGATIDGEINSSIICRDVKVGKGSKITNSIIMSGVEIGENVVMDHVIVDKYAKIIHKKELFGTKEQPLYVKQGDSI